MFAPLPDKPDHPALDLEILDLWEREDRLLETRVIGNGRKLGEAASHGAAVYESPSPAPFTRNQLATRRLRGIVTTAHHADGGAAASGMCWRGLD